MPITPTVFKRPIDQRLYDVLIEAHSYDGNIAEKINAAAALIADGANVNAQAVSSEVPDGFMLGCVLSELDYDNAARLAVIDLFLAHGFDPDKGDDVNGAQALTFLVNYCEGDAGGKVLECVKTLLRKGCNPFVELKLYKDDIDEFDVCRWALDEFGDVLGCDHDTPSLVAYSAISWCLMKFQNGDDFESVGQVTEAVGFTVDEIRLKGNFTVEPTEKAGVWKYWQQIKLGEPFDSGILVKCGSSTLFMDPEWGIFTDTNLPKEWAEQLSDPVDFSVKGKILGIEEAFVRGRIHFVVQFEDRKLIISDFDKTITLETSDELSKATE